MALDTDKDGIPDSIDPQPNIPDTKAPVIQAPAVGGNPYASSSAFPAKGTNVFRPGVTYTDPATGKKVDVTGKIYKALYTATNEEAMFIKNSDLATLQDQNQVKSLLVAGGFLDKSAFQTAYWGQKDTEAFRELLAEANSAGGLTYQEMIAKIASGELQRGATGPTKNIAYNISDPASARGIAQNGLRAILGRDPSSKETKMLVEALNIAEKASPSVTTQTMTAPGVYTSTTTGGLGAAGTQQVIEEAIMGTPSLEAEAVDKRLNGYGDIIGRLAGEF